MTQAHIVVDHLVKTYPGAVKPSVDQVSFSLPRGEMLALLGPSGCGKTSILRMIAGLVVPTSGSILLDGREISQTPVHERNMGMVFQAYALFPHMTIAQNIAFGLEMRGIPKTESARRVARALDLVKLTGLGDRTINQLSGGQQQRCAIARSLVIEPALLLLDEPLSNLDAKLRDEMRDEIRDIQKRTNVTTIFVTHDQDEALSMADRVAVMSDGRLEQIGTPRQIFDHPATEFAAAFIGAGNFFQGRVIEKQVAEVAVLGRLHFDGDWPVGADVRLLIRPHRLKRIDEASATHNVFRGHIAHIVYRGQIVTLSVAVGSLTIQADLHTHADFIPQIGDAITLQALAADVTLIGRAG